MGLGRSPVSSESRVPRPPARITAFTPTPPFVPDHREFRAKRSGWPSGFAAICARNPVAQMQTPRRIGGQRGRGGDVVLRRRHGQVAQTRVRSDSNRTRRSGKLGATRLIVGTPIHSASQVVVPPTWGAVSERDVDLVVMAHVVAAHADILQPLGVHVAPGKGRAGVGDIKLARPRLGPAGRQSASRAPRAAHRPRDRGRARCTCRGLFAVPKVRCPLRASGVPSAMAVGRETCARSRPRSRASRRAARFNSRGSAGLR